MEYKVQSDHLSYHDPALEKAVEQYTSVWWPFGRRERASEKLEERQEEILQEFGIEKKGKLGATSLLVSGVESKQEAEEKMESLKDRIDGFYENEFGLDEPFEYELKKAR